MTDEVLEKLNDTDQVAQYAHLFAFSDKNSNLSSGIQRRAGGCKTYPGDSLWPSPFLWDIFDLLLGKAISPIVPIASPCYENSTYDDFNAAKCATISSNWNQGNTQYVQLWQIHAWTAMCSPCAPSTNTPTVRPTRAQSCSPSTKEKHVFQAPTLTRWVPAPKEAIRLTQSKSAMLHRSNSP